VRARARARARWTGRRCGRRPPPGSQYKKNLEGRFCWICRDCFATRSTPRKIFGGGVGICAAEGPDAFARNGSLSLDGCRIGWIGGGSSVGPKHKVAAVQGSGSPARAVIGFLKPMRGIVDAAEGVYRGPEAVLRWMCTRGSVP
jgi:hypothetical protein